MKQRILCILLAVVLLCGLLPPLMWSAGAEEANGSPFRDLPPTADSYEAILYLYERGVVNGTGPDTISPDGSLNRAMITTLVHRAVLCPPSGQDLPYEDISLYGYYTAALRWCHEKGIIRGTSETSFSPERSITTEELAVILYRLADYRGEDLSIPSVDWSFADERMIGNYAKTAVRWAAARGYLSCTWVGDSCYIRPRKALVRSEAFQVLFRFCLERDLPSQNFWSAFSRSCYPKLSDDEYANFRMVKTAGIAQGILYRGCSPIDYSNLGARITISAARLRECGIQTILNLANTKYQATHMPDYQNVAGIPNIVFCAMSEKVSSESFRSGLEKALRYLAAHRGPYYVHCTYGKDRAGMTIALLECLMGATYEEIEADYLQSYHNYFQVVYQAQRPLTIWQKKKAAENFREFFGRGLLGTEDLAHADLQACAERYCKTVLNLTDAELQAIRANLSD